MKPLDILLSALIKLFAITPYKSCYEEAILRIRGYMNTNCKCSIYVRFVKA